MNLYIYYDVAAVDGPTVAAAVRRMQATLGPPASTMQLLRRADTRGDRQTWMEIYADVPDAFEARVAASAGAHGLDALTGPRHVERFVPVA